MYSYMSIEKKMQASAMSSKHIDPIFPENI